MKTLMLLRHGKSSWENPEFSDFERPLNRRGRKAAKLMGTHIRASAEMPELILCSGARRARETLEYSKLAELAGVSVSIEDGLYLASMGQLADRVFGIANSINTVLMIGHNPGMGELARFLEASSEPGEIRRLQGNFPTCAFAAFQLDLAMWSEFPGPRVRLWQLVFPRELSDVSS